VLVRPPLVPATGLASCVSWLGPVFSVSDADLVRTAGLDALMVHRVLTFGVLFFGPYALLSCCTLLPLYSAAARAAPPPPPGASSALNRLAMGSLPRGSPLLWVPACVTAVGVVFGCALLSRFVAEAVLLRQAYLASGDASLAAVAAVAEGGARGSDLAARQRGLPRRAGGAGAPADPPSASSSDAGDEPPPLLFGGGAVEPEPPPPPPLPVHPPVSDLETAPSPRPTLLDRWWDGAGDGKGARRAPVALVKAARAVGGGAPWAAAEMYACLALDVPPPPPRSPPTPPLHARCGAALAGCLPASAAGAAILCAGPLASATVAGFDGRGGGVSDLDSVPRTGSLRLTAGSAGAAVARRRRSRSDAEAGARPAPPPPPHDAPATAWFEHASTLGGAELVDAVFQRVAPRDYHACLPVADPRPAHAALCAWDAACARLAVAEAAAKRADAAGAPRPAVRPWRWWRRGGPPPSDAVDAAAAAVRIAEDAVLAAQAAAAAGVADGVAPAYVVLFATQAAAAAAAAAPPFPQGWRQTFTVTRAPGPDEVCWQTVAADATTRRSRRRRALLSLLFFMGLPIGIFAGALANVEYALCVAAPAPARARRAAFCSHSSFARSLLTGTLPPILVSMWSCLVMPKALYKGALLLSQDAGLAGVDRRVFWLAFAWTAFNVDAGCGREKKKKRARERVAPAPHLSSFLQRHPRRVRPRRPARPRHRPRVRLPPHRRLAGGGLVLLRQLSGAASVADVGLPPPLAVRGPPLDPAPEAAHLADTPGPSRRRFVDAPRLAARREGARRGRGRGLSRGLCVRHRRPPGHPVCRPLVCSVLDRVALSTLVRVRARVRSGRRHFLRRRRRPRRDARRARLLHRLRPRRVWCLHGGRGAGGGRAGGRVAVAPVRGRGGERGGRAAARARPRPTPRAFLPPPAPSSLPSRLTSRYGARAAAAPSLLTAAAPRARVDPRADTPAALRGRAAGWAAGAGCGWAGWGVPAYFPG